MDNRTEPLADGVWRVEVGMVTNAYVVARDGLGDGDGLVLIDPGRGRSAPQLVRSVRLLGFDPRAIGQVLLTHWHADHAGAAAALAASSARPTVHARPPDSEILAGRAGRPAAASHPLGRLRQRCGRRPPSASSLPLEDGQVLPGGIEVVASPGHTVGHTAFWLPDRGTLLAGDALFGVLRTTPGPLGLSGDPAAVPATLRRLARLAPTVVALGHGPPRRRGAAARLTDIAERVADRRASRPPG